MSNITKDTLSVVIPAYGCANSISAVIDSLLEQTPRPNEIIVVNDNSPDNLLEVLKSYGTEIVIIDSEINSGLSASYNKGLLKAKGGYLMTLHSDCVLRPNYISNLISILKNYEKCGGICGEYDFKGSSIRSFSDQLFTILNRLPIQPEPNTKIRELPFLEGKADIYKREAIEPLGFFTERLRITCEDQDLCARMREQGWVLLQDPSTKFGVKFSTTQDSLKKVFNKQRTYARGQAYILLKHGKNSIKKSSNNRDIRVIHRALQVVSPWLIIGLLSSSFYFKSIVGLLLLLIYIVSRYLYYFTISSPLSLFKRLSVGFYGIIGDFYYSWGFCEGILKTLLTKRPI
jgi:cellulose synthase/poly-beta-1,6-N-acetylglucosamine synthase-like glycosyltransferase